MMITLHFKRGNLKIYLGRNKNAPAPFKRPKGKHWGLIYKDQK